MLIVSGDEPKSGLINDFGDAGGNEFDENVTDFDWEATVVKVFGSHLKHYYLF